MSSKRGPEFLFLTTSSVIRHAQVERSGLRSFDPIASRVNFAHRNARLPASASANPKCLWATPRTSSRKSPYLALKIRGRQIIADLEGMTRGPYAGCVGYFSFNGNLDTCITILTALVKGGKAYVQAGGG